MVKKNLLPLLLVLSMAVHGQAVLKYNFSKKNQNVLALAMSPDGTQIATGGDDNKIAIWSTTDGKENYTVNGEDSWITSLAFHSNGKFLASGERSGKVTVFDLSTGTAAYHFEGHKGTVYSADFNVRYNYLATSGADGMLKIWDMASRQIIKNIKVCDKELLVVRFSPDNAKVLTAGSDGYVKEWDVLSGNMIRSIEAHPSNYIRSAAYSPSGEYIASGGDDKSVKIWNVSNGRLYKELPKTHRKWIQTLQFASDNLHLVSGGHDGTAFVWNIEKGIDVATLKQGGVFVSGALFTPDLKMIVTTGYESKGAAWNIESLQLKPAPTATEANAVSVASRNSQTETTEKKNVFELVQPRIKTGEPFVCLEDEVKIRGMVTLEFGVREIAAINKQSGQREKLKLNTGGLFEHSMKLAFLDNEITIEAIDTKGTKLEKKFTVYRIFDKNNPSELAKLSRSGTDYALIIATNSYQAMNPLVNPVFDANTIASELENNYNFQVEKLIDPPLSQITLKIREYARKMYSDDDQLFIFIAGHGEYDDFYKEGYLVATDSKKGDEGKTSYLPHSALRTYINNIPCKHIFLAMDVCFGGTFDPYLASSRGNEESAQAERAYFIKRKLNSKTRLYLTSGGKEYVPDGRPGQHSPFARKFLEALSTYGGADRILTYKEILGVVESVIPEPRYGEFGDNQPGSDFIFIGR